MDASSIWSSDAEQIHNRETTEEAAKSLGLEYRMEKETDIQAIMGFGVMMTPALAEDGRVKVSGKIPTREELRQILASS